MDVTHYRNFLGPPRSSLCGELDVPDESLTFAPDQVTCEKCLGMMGRLRSEGFGIPTGKKPKGEG